jgi:hypothetical protein
MGGPLDDHVNDENLVTLEYKCSDLESYNHVPQEVRDECELRIELLERQQRLANSKNLL